MLHGKADLSTLCGDMVSLTSIPRNVHTYQTMLREATRYVLNAMQETVDATMDFWLVIENYSIYSVIKAIGMTK